MEQMVFDSGADTANLVKITLPQGTLSHDTTYTWQVRYQDDRGLWSAWSEKTSFTTMPREQFSFAQVTDAHVGGTVSRWQLSPGFVWDAPLDTITHLREITTCYSNFLDTLLAINSLDPPPDFFLITGDNVDFASEANLGSFKNALANPYFNRLPVYSVPGNHDRHEYPLAVLAEGVYVGGNDHLSEYCD